MALYQNSGFGLNGATGNYSNGLSGYLSGFMKPKQTQSTPAPNMSTVNGPVYAPPPVTTPPVHTTAPTSQPIASHTTKDASGNSTTVKYVPPPTTPTASSQSVKQADGSYTLTAPGMSTPNPAPTVQGNFTTPSGAVVNGQTGSLVSGPTATSQTPNTYSGFIGALGKQSVQGNPQATQATQGLIGAANGNTALGQNAADIANKYGQQYADVGQQGAKAQAGYLTTGTSPVGEGNAAVVNQSTAAQQSAIAAGEQAALQGNAQQLTAQGQQQSGLASAGSLANQSQGLVQSGLTSGASATQPIQLPYSNQLVNPATGQSVGNTSGTLTDAVANITKQLQDGTIGYDDAKAQLAGYGQGGLNALSQWATDNKFNVAQSNVLAAQQGAITPNLNYANAALDNLSNAMGNLQVWGQNSNIPILGGLANWFSTQSGIGKQETGTKAGAVGEAQQAIASVLASVKGGTPTDYGSQARALLPDNPTPSDVAAAKANLIALGQQKQSIYGNPGAVNANTSSTGTITTPYGNINPNL